MNFIANDLEGKCRRIAQNIMKNDSEPTPTTFIGREISLILDHMKSIRNRHASHRAEFLKKELDTGSQILNTEGVNRLVGFLEILPFATYATQILLST